MGERQFGPYRLVRQLAVGGMAEIHLAKTKGIAGFEKYVALKMIHPNFAADDEFIQMLVDEAKIAVQLNHGNIAQTFDLGRVGDTYYITMEYVDGADLYKILRRSSEHDIELPLDVCAFIAKEVAGALDHAHRKRDHHGKPLGIVHRDVSPQNVLISYAGEVKLVDFGIAKATMKVKQTAVGVIKGKYYYMSPEQARGDQIDSRSDIFSAGIVLYEMMTGQMLYLEEDLHRLLDMARAADIAPPTSLRKAIPPQLERIVMRALAKSTSDRYRSAGDFATDLERFLHAYSPVFTGAKVAALLRQVFDEPSAPPEADIEIYEGPEATFTLNPEDLIHDKDEIRDENSVIFKLDDLKSTSDERPKAARVTREASLQDLVSRPAAAEPRAKARTPSKPNPVVAGNGGNPPSKRPTQPRDAREHTREVDPVPTGAGGDTGEDSGLLPSSTFDRLKTPVRAVQFQAGSGASELDNIAESTLITPGPPIAHGFVMDIAGEDGVEATLITAGPPQLEPELEPPSSAGEDGETGLRPTVGSDTSSDDLEAPTIERDFLRPPPQRRVTAQRASPPAALAAKIHAPAVSELRKPRTSRKTPGVGSPNNVLQAIVGAAPAEPMPAPPKSRDDSGANTLPEAPRPNIPQPPPFAGAPPGTAPPFAPQAMPGMPGMPLGQAMPGMPPPQAMSGFPPPYAPQYPLAQAQGGYPVFSPPHQQPFMPQQPGIGYPGQPVQGMPYGSPMFQPQMSMTGQMRLYEVDELPPQYRISSSSRAIKLAIGAVLAVSVAAAVTFFIIRSAREMAPSFGAIRVTSIPEGAEVSYDGQRLAGGTPMTIEEVPLGTRHEIKVVKEHNKPHIETVDVPKTGGQVEVSARLDPITGTLKVVSHPDGAEVVIDGQLRGRAPTILNGVDMGAARKLELRLKDYQPYVQDLTWPANGEIDIEHTLVK